MPRAPAGGAIIATSSTAGRKGMPFLGPGMIWAR
jgi:hypothetical protein